MASTKRGKSTKSLPEGHPESQTKPLWKRGRTWLIGLPAAVILLIVSALVWGSLQPKPQGFAVAEPEQATPSTSEPVAAFAGAEESNIPAKSAPPVEPVRYTLDARSTDDWVFFDFTQGRVIQSEFPSGEWDLAFRRTKLLTNSGVTNPGGPGGAFDLGEVALEDAEPPAGVVFVVDSLGGEDGDEPENAAAGKWYTYSFISHIVSAKPNTYLIRTGDESDALVRFQSYYCEDDEAGCITFSYRLVSG